MCIDWEQVSVMMVTRTGALSAGVGVTIWPCVIVLLRFINILLSGGKHTEPGFPLRFSLFLAPIDLIFVS